MRKPARLSSVITPAVLSLLVLSHHSYAAEEADDDEALSNYPAQEPLLNSTSSTPLNMLVMGRDHKLYFEAYNDASDLNDDGTLDVGYKGYLSKDNGGIDYFGYFNSYVCYSYDKTNHYFKPESTAKNKQCDGSKWSGDYLNYLTTSRMDALRKVLYGGYRKVDTEEQTVLEGAYIPRDSHTWGKEANHKATDNDFDVSKFTPLTNPESGKRHLFSVTSTTDGETPRLQVIKSTTNRIWDWVSKERPVAQTTCLDGGSSTTEKTCYPNSVEGTDYYQIRVLTCPTASSQESLRDDNCKSYAKGTKPTGVLHTFGETDRMHFGLLTGSYENSTAGGILRSNIGSFAKEIDPVSGVFCLNKTATNKICDFTGAVKEGIVYNINQLRIINFNHTDNFYAKCPWIANMTMAEAKGKTIDGRIVNCYNWGNPIGEMMYETLRYYAGATGPTPTYDYGSGATAADTATLKLTKPTWIPPYATNYPSCSVPAMTVISDINPSFDNKLPESNWSPITNVLSKISTLNVSTEVNEIGAAEGIHGNDYFIGEANGISDGTPSIKRINNLSMARGLAPEEPSREGTYYSAGIAKYAAENKVGGSQKLYTYVVSLASPLPEIKFGGATIIPFAKTVAGEYKSKVDRDKAFRPTNPIADYYVETLGNTGSVKDGTNDNLPYMIVRINFEDQEQGADFDMDAFATYTIKERPGNRIEVTVDVKKDGGTAWTQNLGYIISGTGATDGTYLEVCASGGNNCPGSVSPAPSDSSATKTSYYALNTPGNELPGYCALPAGVTDHTKVSFGNANGTSTVDKRCYLLPRTKTRTFQLANTDNKDESGVASAGLLESPLFYAAKYGIPGRNPEDVKGQPDNYFLVTNALDLKTQLTKAFSDFDQVNNSINSPAVAPGNEVEDGFSIYRTDYQASTWTGDLIKEELDPSTGVRSVKWKASSSLKASGRTIYIANEKGSDLVDFTWQALAGREAYDNAGTLTNLQVALSQAHDKALEKPRDPAVINTDLGVKRLKFILGAADSDFRARESILGDIINSNPVVVGGAMYLNYLAENLEPGSNYAKFAAANKDRAKHIYVGANDGMLHSFTDSGSEAFAFVPTAVIPELHHLTKATYNRAGGDHKYYVDGSPVVRDVYIGGQWKTVLIGTLRAGGRSIFALDITVPTAPSLLWEFNHGDDLTKEELEAQTVPVSDMGYSFPTPTIAKLHSGHWAVVTGNGYDSPSGRAALLLIDIANGKLLKKIPTADKDSFNGLSSVRVADNNSDGVADYVYAGDLKGNLWRFDLFGTSLARSDNVKVSAFKLSYGGNPLYTAVNDANKRQPITAPPSLVRHPSAKGYIVIFGTGRYFRAADKENGEKAIRQSLYGIWDQQTKGEATAKPSTALTREDLQQQTFTEEKVTHTVGDATITSTVRVHSQNPVTWRVGTEGSMGWYIDLGPATPDGERLVSEMAPRGQVLIASTMVPKEDPCKPGIDGWMYGINPFTGGRANFAVFDFNQDGKVDPLDNNSDGESISGFKVPGGSFNVKDNRLFTTDGGSRAVSFGPAVSGRQSWQVIPE